MTMRFSVAIAILLLAVPSLAAPPKVVEEFGGKVIGVTEGDTIKVLVGKETITVRLEGIDAPESGQSYGAKAKQALADLVAEKTVTVKKTGMDKDGRALGIVLVGEVDAGAKLVADGWAWHFRKYNDEERLAKLEEAARKAKRGLWADENPVAPWDYRARQRTPPATTDKSKDQADKLGPGDHTRKLTLGELERTYLVHVPKGYDPSSPAPVVLALHGALMNGPMMVWFSGLNKKADEAGFIVVYPSGTGTGTFLTWNAGGFPGKWAEGRADDVAFIGKLMDDLFRVVAADEKRVYACGMSNGGMMCYRLAAEMSDRIAAIAPVAGAVALEESKPSRPVPVIHFHGSKDNIVPFEEAASKARPFMKFKSVEESIQTWVTLNGCEKEPTTDTLSNEADEMKIYRRYYGGGKEGSEVVLVLIEDGGHTWPGQQPPVDFIGKSAKNISANEVMWKFFQKHKLK